MNNITIVTDVSPSTNTSGVITWLINMKKSLEQQGFVVTLIQHEQFTSFPLPMYPEIKISLLTRKKMDNLLTESKPDYIHIATEGPLGLVARAVCLKNKWQFTTFYHTRLPEYIYVRLKTFKGLTYDYLRWFHNASACTMVSTESMKQELKTQQFNHITVVPLGVDIHMFQKNPIAKLPPQFIKPIFVYVGRVALEKNLEAFLDCNLPGSKLIIGDGPAKLKLQEKYRDEAFFVGYKSGKELVDLLSISDVFVFPSKTDTFGLTIIEALACELPVAAYDIQGPNNIITHGKDGFLGDDLETNAKKCLTINRSECVKKAMQYSWENATKIFVANLGNIR
ncbi:MAG TPA: glycosyltransferase family 1 protein [Candidatus Paceibacterota bacterium]